jgi:hypothetical protein
MELNKAQFEATQLVAKGRQVPVKMSGLETRAETLLVNLCYIAEPVQPKEYVGWSPVVFHILSIEQAPAGCGSSK